MTVVHHALYAEGKVIADDLYRLIQIIDRGTWRAELDAAGRTILARIEARLRPLMSRAEPLPGDRRIAALQKRLLPLAREVRNFCARHSLSSSVSKGHWHTFVRRISPMYQGIVAHLRVMRAGAISLRPSNYKRTLFHMASGLTAIGLFQHLLTTSQAIYVAAGCALFCWCIELIRRQNSGASRAIMRVFDPIAHPQEHRRISSATWFCTAMFLLALTTSKMVGTVSLTVLTLADPAASLVGRRFGSILLRAGRSLQGTATFVVIAFLSSWGAMRIYHPEVGLGTALQLALVAAVVGALAELFSWRVDDNLSIPLSVGVALTACGWLLF